MSYYFDGVNAKASCTVGSPCDNAKLAATGFTFVTYIQPETTAASKCLITSQYSGGTYYFLHSLDTDLYPRARTRDNATLATCTTTVAISTGAWAMTHSKWGTGSAYRQAGFHNSSYPSGYYETADTTDATTLDFTPNRIWVGYRPTNLEFFKGYMAIAAMYEGLLSDSELDELYTVQPQSASSYSKCLALWDMRNSHGTTEIADALGTYTLTLEAVNGTTKPVHSTENPTLGTGASPLILPHRSSGGLIDLSGNFRG